MTGGGGGLGHGKGDRCGETKTPLQRRPPKFARTARSGSQAVGEGGVSASQRSVERRRIHKRMHDGSLGLPVLGDHTSEASAPRGRTFHSGSRSVARCSVSLSDV